MRLDHIYLKCERFGLWSYSQYLSGLQRGWTACTHACSFRRPEWQRSRVHLNTSIYFVITLTNNKFQGYEDITHASLTWRIPWHVRDAPTISPLTAFYIRLHAIVCLSLSTRRWISAVALIFVFPDRHLYPCWWWIMDGCSKLEQNIWKDRVLKSICFSVDLLGLFGY